MSHCDGRLYDGSACNNDVLSCSDCGASGCAGDGCDYQSFAGTSCDCGGSPAAVRLVAATAAA